MKNENVVFKKAIILMIICGFTSSMVSICAKGGGEISPIQKLFFQNITVVAFGLPFMIKNGFCFQNKNKVLIPLLLRCVFGVLAATISFYCLQRMLVADVNMLLEISPIFTAIFGFFMLKERFPKSNWIFYSFALFGCLLIIKPGTNNVLLVPALLCILCAIISSVDLNLLRILGKKGMVGLPVIFYFGLFSILVSFPWVIFNFVPMGKLQFLSIVGIGVFTLLTQIFLSYAYTMAPSGRISIYSYVGILFCGINGYIFFKEIPDKISLVGYALIIFTAAGLYIRDNK
ncbi:MAG: DMT family transporter [Sphaerochaetaceae bacterium]